MLNPCGILKMERRRITDTACILVGLLLQLNHGAACVGSNRSKVQCVKPTAKRNQQTETADNSGKPAKDNERASPAVYLARRLPHRAREAEHKSDIDTGYQD